MQPQHDPLLASDLLLAVAVDEERERRPVGPAGRLDDVRDVVLLGRRVEVLEVLPGRLLVAGQVEAGPKRLVIEPLGIEFGDDALQLR